MSLANSKQPQSSSVSSDTAVLMIVFNRRADAEKVLNAVREARPSRLYIAADGPRPGRPDDIAKCADTRAVVDLVDWPCEVKTRFLDENVGCGLGPKTAIDWLFEHEESGIILEDDCVPHPTFFRFCHELLEKYADDSRVMMVGGNLHVKGWQPLNGASYAFSNHGFTWGWATWKRAWVKYDYDLRDLPQVMDEKIVNHLFTSPLERRYRMGKIKEVYDAIQAYGREKISVWDYQWDYARFVQNGLCIVPGVNFVRNIGFGEDATHTLNTADQRLNFHEEGMTFPLVHPKYVVADQHFDRLFFNGFILKGGIIRKLKSFIPFLKS